VFGEMHGEMAVAAKTDRRLADWRARLEVARKKRVYEQMIYDRELFVALQSEDRLLAMIEDVRKRITD
jgi:lysyl-tRNA synthetase class I